MFVEIALRLLYLFVADSTGCALRRHDNGHDRIVPFELQRTIAAADFLRDPQQFGDVCDVQLFAFVCHDRALRFARRVYHSSPRWPLQWPPLGLFSSQQKGSAKKCASEYKIGVASRLMPLMYRMLPSRLWDAFWAHQFPMT